MKYTKLLLAIGLLFTFSVVTAQDSKKDQKTIQYKVYGNCGMCKKTIEGSLKGVSGIKNASWNEDTKMMKVSYDASKISEEEIQQKVADSGYDTATKIASEKAYNNLAGCCQYERKK